MQTTLRTGALVLDTEVEYKFSAADKKLIIKLTSDGDHKLYGDVNIALSHADEINIKKTDGSIVEDYFNNTFKFSKVSDTVLEYSETIESGIAISEVFADLPDDGADVEADIVNSSIDLPAGKHDFFLLDTADMDFSTSKIGIKYLNIEGTGVDGIESVFDEEGEGDFLSINNQSLIFTYPVRVSLFEDNSGVTNIPLIINA